MSLEPGHSVGSYEVLAPLGKGGMGEVYRARDTKLGREVAIKVLGNPSGSLAVAPQLRDAADPERLARLEREAKLLAALNHPNIATLHAFEREGNTSFLVMELVEGEDLAVRLQRGAIPLDEALAVFTQIAAGLEAAHERGILHRDLKPANLMLLEDGGVKILDFGLAKEMAAEDSPADMSQSPTLTQAATLRGEVLGTAPYMSPEQAKGKRVDKQTDVFAFGACLFEALAGQRAFGGGDVTDTLASVLAREPDWNALPSGLDPRLVRLLERCLAKEKKSRARDIGDVALSLQDIAEAPLPPPPEPTREWTRTLLLVAAASAVTLLGTLLATRSLPSEDEAPPAARVHLNLRLPTGQQLSTFAPLAISADGRRVAYTTRDRELYVRELGDPQPRLLARGTLLTEAPFFSPDGLWVGAQIDADLIKVPISGGEVVPLTRYESSAMGGFQIIRGSWDEQESILVGVERSLRRVASAGSGESILLEEITPWAPQVLPTGQILYSEWGLLGAQVHDPETNETSVVLEGAGWARYLPTGHLLFGNQGALKAVRFDLAGLTTVGDPVTLLTDIAGGAVDGTDQKYAVSETGTLVYVRNVDVGRRLILLDRTGNASALDAPLRPYRYLRLSPEEDALVARIGRDLWTLDLQRGVLTRVTHDTGIYPLWSPRPGRLLFSRRGVYETSTDGSGMPVEVLARALHLEDVSPVDGTVIAHAHGQASEGGGVWRWDLSSGETEHFLPAAVPGTSGSSVSPDGHWVAFQSSSSGRWEIYAQRLDGAGRRIQISSEGGVHARWRGDEIFYRQDDAVLATRFRTDGAQDIGPEVEPSRVLFRADLFNNFQTFGDWDVSADGERFYMLEETGEREEIVVVLNWLDELERLLPND